MTPGSQDFTGGHGRHTRTAEQGSSRPSSGLWSGAARIPCHNPAPQGPLEVLQQQLGKEESGRSISMEGRTLAVPVDPHVWIHEIQPSALTAKAPNPPPTGESLQHSQNSYRVLQNYF